MNATLKPFLLEVSLKLRDQLNFEKLRNWWPWFGLSVIISTSLLMRAMVLSNQLLAPSGTDFLSLLPYPYGSDQLTQFLAPFPARVAGILLLAFDRFTTINIMFYGASVAAAIPFFLLARVFSNNWIALVTTAVLMFSNSWNLMSGWGNVSTQYSLFFFLFGLYYLWRQIHGPSRRNWILTGIFAALSYGSHLPTFIFFLIVLGGVASFFFVFERHKNSVRWSDFGKIILVFTLFAVDRHIWYLGYFSGLTSYSSSFLHENVERSMDIHFIANNFTNVLAPWEIWSGIILAGFIGLAISYRINHRFFYILCPFFAAVFTAQFTFLSLMPLRPPYYVPFPTLLAVAVLTYYFWLHSNKFTQVLHIISGINNKSNLFTKYSEYAYRISIILVIGYLAVSFIPVSSQRLYQSSQFHKFIGNEELSLVYWISANTNPDDVILTQHKNLYYGISTLTGRMTWPLSESGLYRLFGQDLLEKSEIGSLMVSANRVVKFGGALLLDRFPSTTDTVILERSLELAADTNSKSDKKLDYEHLLSFSDENIAISAKSALNQHADFLLKDAPYKSIEMLHSSDNDVILRHVYNWEQMTVWKTFTIGSKQNRIIVTIEVRTPSYIINEVRQQFLIPDHVLVLSQDEKTFLLMTANTEYTIKSIDLPQVRKMIEIDMGNPSEINFKSRPITMTNSSLIPMTFSSIEIQLVSASSSNEAVQLIDLEDVMNKNNINFALIDKKNTDKIAWLSCVAGFERVHETRNIVILKRSLNEKLTPEYLKEFWFDDSFKTWSLSNVNTKWKGAFIIEQIDNGAKYPHARKDVSIQANETKYFGVKWKGAEWTSGKFAIGVKLANSDKPLLLKSYSGTFDWKTDIIDLHEVQGAYDQKITKIIIWPNYGTNGKNVLYVDWVGIFSDIPCKQLLD